MKIAIHHLKGSFSDRWISYCIRNNVSYKIVDCYDSDIVSQLNDCSGLMWHWDLNDYKSALFVRQLTKSIESKGIKVFPDVNTSWHYDDKVGQKYLLEAINAPLVKSYIFYSKQKAYEWIEKTTFPKVFKLRVGAASVNVSLVKTAKKAKQLVNKAFSNGFSHIDPFNRLKHRIWVFKRDKKISGLKMVLTGIVRIFIPNVVERFSHNEKGYIYFQDFIPDNNFDTRLVIVGNRCFGVRRFCRKGDFRASGSGICDANPDLINPDSIKIAFDVAKKIGSQSIAFDFVLDHQKPKIIEISYCFPLGAPDDCAGYWDENLIWHDEKVNAEEFMIEDFIKDLEFLNEHKTVTKSTTKSLKQPKYEVKFRPCHQTTVKSQYLHSM
jgi:glutathione synthase/RimK-type ligase-like ATP-grasp enzyme